MRYVREIQSFLEEYAPKRLSAEWDNTGLLVGAEDQAVERVMTCLTITPDSAAEAVARRTDLIVTHHPLPFQAMRQLTRATTPGRLLLDLIAARVAVYSPHTAFDSAAAGINQRLAEGLGLADIEPLLPDPAGQGAGRWGRLESAGTVGELIRRTREFLGLDRLQVVGEDSMPVERVAVGCGAAGEFLPAAVQHGCQAMLLGEARFHTCLEAEAMGIALILPGHFASERFALEHLADVLANRFPDLEIWASRTERDPIRYT